MRYAVLGAGMMGKAIAYDLLNQDDTSQLIFADANQESLAEASAFLNDSRLQTTVFNAADPKQVKDILSGVEAAVAAVNYEFNVLFTKSAIEAKTHLCDLGGNNTIVDRQLSMHDEALKADISVIPDCGLAPGMVALLVKWGIEKFDWVDTIKIRVGGLPKNPSGILKYCRLFASEGLINEYSEPVRVLRDGEIRTIEPLTGLELIRFPPPFGTLEAFATSGGISTLAKSYKGRLKNLDYKTIRYPGHLGIVRGMLELGFFSDEDIMIDSIRVKPRRLARVLFEKNLPACHDDVVLVRIVFEKASEEESHRHQLTAIIEATKDPPLTAMMRATGFPAAIISLMQARGQISRMGVLPQEQCVPTAPFISELDRRGINVDGL